MSYIPSSNKKKVTFHINVMFESQDTATTRGESSKPMNELALHHRRASNFQQSGAS